MGKPFIIAYMVQNENNHFFKWSLLASKAVADHIIIIDGGSTDGTRDLIRETLGNFSHELIVDKYESEYVGSDGLQRNKYLKGLKEKYYGCPVLVLDADEVISDNAFKLRTFADLHPETFMANVRMRHYIWHFGLEDSSVPEHYVQVRFFRVGELLFYPEEAHSLLKGGEYLGNINDNVVIHHLGYLKGINGVMDKIERHRKKSHVHTPEFLNKWINGHTLGLYPVKEVSIDDLKLNLPWPIKKSLGLE